VRILEIAQFCVGDNTYLGIDNTSFATIFDEILTATEGLGDLSFCLGTPGVDFSARHEIPRSPHEIKTASPYRVYEEMICHRFPKAEPIAISHHAKANYYRFVNLQNTRKQGHNAELDEDESSLRPAHLLDIETQTIPRTNFHDSGIGTSHRHESSYAQSLMSFTRRSHEQYAKLLPKLPQEGISGGRFECCVCLRKVQFSNEGLWK
jgi:hypothetical protein